MWNKPWGLKEGFLIGGGLIVAGLLLELCVGSIDWSVYKWPYNMIVLFCLVLLIFLMGWFTRKVYVFRFLTTLPAAVPAMVYAVLLTIVMGVTRQSVNGTWIHGMLTFWPFVLVYVYMTIILGMVIVKRFRHLKGWKQDVPFLLNHLGLFVALTCGTLGNPDIQQLKMITTVNEAEWRALDKEHNIVELPIAIQLNQFIMEEYEDGTPKRFASDIQIITKSGKNVHAVVDVNKPVEVDGWKIYQYGYDTEMGKLSKISIFELVKDPWLISVYIGIGMMLLGTIFILLFGVRRNQV